MLSTYVIIILLLKTNTPFRLNITLSTAAVSPICTMAEPSLDFRNFIYKISSSLKHCCYLHLDDSIYVYSFSHSFFSSPPQRTMRSYPLHVFSYLNSWERASVFAFECSVLNKGTTGTIFITSSVWCGPWLGIEPGTSRTRSQHYATRLSRRRLFLRWLEQFELFHISICKACAVGRGRLVIDKSWLWTKSKAFCLLQQEIVLLLLIFSTDWLQEQIPARSTST